MAAEARFPNLHVSDHALAADKLARIRARDTSPGDFRRLMREIGSILAIDALRRLPQVDDTIETPLETTTAKRLASPPVVVPILRAGLPLCDGVLDIVHEATVGHLGIRRDEATALPIDYYMKLPPITAATVAIIVDPMLATGGSACDASRRLRSAGCREIRMICLVAAPEGVSRMLKEHPSIGIWTAALDRQLDERFFIRPGLGDAGDRSFGT
ncbi:MAG: uracil phosphoribosyltransferase [Planctomycetota bacterium]|nr:uracil phosphoribosyltransferase [Planctomycetota bacterium]